MKIDTKKLENYARENGIKFIILFGSRAVGGFKDGSDFDVAVALKNGKGFFGDSNLYCDLLDNLGKSLQISDDEIDLTDLNRADILLRYEITSRGNLLYGDADEYAAFQAFAFRDYIDAKPLFALEDLLIRKRQKLIRQAINK